MKTLKTKPTFDPVPYAYKAGENNATIRHPSGNGKPVIDYDLSRRHPETWQAMERLVDSGKVRFIGISNLNILKTKRIPEVARIRPAVNQVEIHPYFPQHDIFDFSSKEGILLMAHQPLGGRPVAVVRGNPDVPPPTEDQKIIDAAAGCGLSLAQLCLLSAVQRGIPVVPKSVQETHMESNLGVKQLPEDVFNMVHKLASERQGPARFLDPSKHFGFDIFDEKHDQPEADGAPWD